MQNRYTRGILLVWVLAGLVIRQDFSFCQSVEAQQEKRAAADARTQSQFDSSIVHFQRAATLFAEAGNRPSYYSCLNNIVDNCIRKSDFFRAESLLCSIEREGSKELGADDTALVATYNLLGYIRTYQDRYTEAVLYYSRAAAIRQKLFGPHDLQIATIEFGLGGAYYRSGNYTLAELCLEIAKEIQSESYGPVGVDLAHTTIMIGAVHADQNQHLKAIGDYQQGLSMLSSLRRDTSYEAASAHKYLGFSYKRLGDFARAAKHETLALDILRSIFGENHATVAACMVQLGDDLASMGDFVTALRYYQRSLLIFQSLLGPGHTSSFEIQRKIANLYAATGDTVRALDLARRVVDGEERVFGPLHPDMAKAYSEIASIYRANGEWKNAREYYAKALRIRQGLEGTRNRLDIAGILESIGETLIQQNKLDSAASTLIYSLQTQDSCEVSNALLRSSTLKNLGDIERRRSNYTGALQFYRASLFALTPGMNDTTLGSSVNIFDGSKERSCVQILAAKALALEELSARSSTDREPQIQALAAYEQASHALDRLRARYRSEGSKLFLQGEVLPIYQAGLGLSVSLYRTTGDPQRLEQAFSFAERAKSAILLERIRGANASHFVGIPDSLRQKEEELSREVATLSMQATLFEEHHDSTGVQRTRTLLIDADEALQRFQRDLERKFPSYFGLRYGSQSATTSELQAVLDPGTCLVEYSFARDSLIIFVIGKDSVRLTSVPAGAHVDKLAQSFVRSLKTMEGDDYIKAARGLYDILISPVASYIRGKKHLVIVPDGILTELPFEALLGPMKDTPAHFRVHPTYSDLPYLLRSHEVTYALSANLLDETLSRKPAVQKQLGSIAGFAPVFRDSSTRTVPPAIAAAAEHYAPALRSITIDNQTYNELKFSEEEVRSILDDFKGKKIGGVGFFHSLATEGNFKANAGNYSILHIATHGYMDDAHPELTALLFAPDKDGGSPEDGVLYAGEAYNLQLNADLVVLSSCESGTGKLEKGEGVMTMARGFFYAGARNLVYSLWKVSDRHTSLLMKAFYRELLSGASLSSALRKAKLDLMKNEATAFPFKWSGFVLVGRGYFLVSSLHPEFSNVH